MIRIIHLLCTGNNCVTRDNCPLTMLRWTTNIIILSLSLTLQRRAGWTTGGVGDYVDTPVAWTELAQLAQCKGQVQEGETLETLVGD